MTNIVTFNFWQKFAVSDSNTKMVILLKTVYGRTILKKGLYCCNGGLKSIKLLYI